MWATFATISKISFPAVVGTCQQIRLSVIVTLDNDRVTMALDDGIRHVGYVSASENCKGI